MRRRGCSECHTTSSTRAALDKLAKVCCTASQGGCSRVLGRPAPVVVLVVGSVDIMTVGLRSAEAKARGSSSIRLKQMVVMLPSCGFEQCGRHGKRVPQLLGPRHQVQLHA